MSHSELNRSNVAAAALVVAALGIIALPDTVAAQHSFAVELRLGATASSSLTSDSIVRQSVLDRLAGKGHVAGQETATPTIAPTIQLSVRTALRPDLQLEGTGGWSFGQLHSGTGAESRTYQSFNIGSATVGLRYAVLPRVHVRGAFGAIHYGSSAGGLFEQGGALEPVVEGAVGSAEKLSFGIVSIEGFAQVHRFGTTTLRQIGGSDGTVFRGGLLVGFAIGSGH